MLERVRSTVLTLHFVPQRLDLNLKKKALAVEEPLEKKMLEIRDCTVNYATKTQKRSFHKKINATVYDSFREFLVACENLITDWTKEDKKLYLDAVEVLNAAKYNKPCEYTREK